jgi:holo-[acyl-carrier protein] synthase
LRFASKILTTEELQIYQARATRWPERGVSFLATRFSAKEAFSKAIGLGLRLPMSWHNCEIVNAKSGAPVLRVLGELKPWFDSRGLSAQVSISDEREYAVSFVIVEQVLKA